MRVKEKAKKAEMRIEYQIENKKEQQQNGQKCGRADRAISFIRSSSGGATISTHGQ